MNTEMPVKEGFVSFHGYKTWYRIVGDHDDPGKFPLMCLHGGPGATHDYFTPLEAMTTTGRRVILYDQLGWGNSDHPHNPSMWTVTLFLDELKLICRSLGLERVHILGHSWGGMLAMEYALTQPAGLISLILTDTLASMPQWIAEAKRLIAKLPPKVQQTLRKHEAAGTTNSPEYQKACRVFSRYYCGGHIDPKPEWVKKPLKNLQLMRSILPCGVQASSMRLVHSKTGTLQVVLARFEYPHLSLEADSTKLPLPLRRQYIKEYLAPNGSSSKTVHISLI